MTKNTDVSTWPLTRLFAHSIKSLKSLTHSLTSLFSLPSCTPLHSFNRSFIHSLMINAGKSGCFEPQSRSVFPFFIFSFPLWSRTTKNTDRSTRPLACPFTCSQAPRTRSLVSLASLARFAALTCLVARSLCSLPYS